MVEDFPTGKVIISVSLKDIDQISGIWKELDQIFVVRTSISRKKLILENIGKIRQNTAVLYCLADFNFDLTKKVEQIFVKLLQLFAKVNV